MAKKNNTAALIIGAGLLYFAVTRMQEQRFTPNPAFPNYPAEPPRNTPQWAQWAQGIINIAGGLYSNLFGPGGPFYGKQPGQVNNEIAQALGGGAWQGWQGPV